MVDPLEMAQNLESRIERIRVYIQLYVWYSARMLPLEASAARGRARDALEELAADLK